ncbi:hypothetical protein ACGFS9_30050 [Streptomyces sp. NPDC048566]|uniref:hypothetical protein n=1 Tax=Streptomyces sp. NPDC048566 TaxID=3365569 RepID=UPI00371418F9
MVRISHTVCVEPVPRRWFEQMLAELYLLAQDTRAHGERILLPGGRDVPGLRLLKGTHLTPGAVYETADERSRTTLSLRSWTRGSTLRVEQVVTDEEMTLGVEAALRSVDHPREAEIRGCVRYPGRWESLLRLEGRARVDLDAWWRAAKSRRPVHAPLTATLTHRLGEATVRAWPRTRPDGRWDVRVVLSARGRSFLRPLAAVGLPAFRGRLGHTFEKSIDGAAEQWNETVPHATARAPHELRSSVLESPQE